MSIEGLLNHIATFKRPVPDYDDMGAVIYNLTTYANSVPCRVSDGVPAAITGGPTAYSEATSMVYLYPGMVNVEIDDVVVARGVSYEVLGLVTPSVEEHHVSLVCKVVTVGS